MSEELQQPVNIDPEEGGEIVGAISTPEPTDEETLPEGTIDGSGGVKFAPLKALISERTSRKEAEKASAAKDVELGQLRTKAQQLDAIANEWQQLQPTLEKVRTGEYVPRQSAAPAKPAEVDPKMQVGEHPITGAPISLLEYTQGLQLYKADGTPDIDQGLFQLGVSQYQSKQQTAKAVAPYQASQAQHESMEQRNQMAQIKDPYGYQVDPAILTKVWSMVPPEISAQPNVAGMLHRIALSEAVLAGKHPALRSGQQAPPLVTTESIGGGRAPEPTSFSDLDAKFATAAGIPKARYTESAGAFKPGQRNSLGED